MCHFMDCYQFQNCPVGVTHDFVLFQEPPDELDLIKWDEEISLEEARHKVEVELLPFKKVQVRS